MALLLYFTYSFLKTSAIHSHCKKIYVFIVNLGVLDLEFFTKLPNLGVLRFLVKVFEYGYISVTISNYGIAFIFYIQLAKDLGNPFPGYFCKLRRFRLRIFLQNVGVLKFLVQVFESASNLEMCY